MPVYIEFDDLEPGTTVTNHYESKGVVFTEPCSIVQDPETFSHSLRSQQLARLADTPLRLLKGRFTNDRHSNVAVHVSFSSAGADGVSAVLRVFDASGNKLDERQIGSPGPDAKGEITVPTANIASFEITGRTNQFDCLDSLSFDRPPEADFRLVYDASCETPTMHATNTDVIRVQVKIFRLHGSYGELLLAMTRPCPGTTWKFDPPVVHSGVPHVDIQIRSSDQAAPVHHFNIDIVAFPRSRTAGLKERVISIPINILAGRPGSASEDGRWVDDEDRWND